MLRAAINYKETLNKKIAEKACLGELIDLGTRGYNQLSIDIKDNNWISFQFVSILNEALVGYICFMRDNPGNIIENVIIVSFADSFQETACFGLDCKKLLKECF